ncbi:MAG: hypothetical protein L0Y68_02315 [Candidatus Dadabacteria bacterium]|nr:hypothetical protein [Candidatus Dadabacteria bacterium]
MSDLPVRLFRGRDAAPTSRRMAMRLYNNNHTIPTSKTGGLPRFIVMSVCGTGKSSLRF